MNTHKTPTQPRQPKAATGKVSASKTGRPEKKLPSESPVETLPARYDAYFQRRFGRRPVHPAAYQFCCLNAHGIPDGPGIGRAFAELTRSLRAADPEFGATEEEIEAIGSWPPEQLQLFRYALQQIFPPCPDAPAGQSPPLPPDPLWDPVPTRFRGRAGRRERSITVTYGTTIEILFEGP